MKRLYVFLFALLPALALAGGNCQCPQDMTVYADGPNCTATVVLPSPPWAGVCGQPGSCSVTIPGENVSFNGQNWVAHNLSEGWYTVYYSSQGPCQQNLHCTMQLHVIGGGNITAVCDQNTVVALGANGVGRIYAETFNDYSNTSCGNIASISVRRIHQGWCPPGVKDDTQYGPYVEFCCEDIAASPIEVMLRVTDNHGNTNECTALVHVQDKLAPFICCPPDITVDCGFPINMNNLDIFGTVVSDPSQRDPIYLNGQCIGYDGYASDNCDVTIEETVCKEISGCGTGWIQRTFTATDPYGNIAHCTQFIYIRSEHPFNETDINWPDDITVYECNPDDLSPEVTGKPQFDDKPCSLVAYTYEDLVFRYTSSDACMKILREWTVLDCCNYNRYTGSGLFTYRQLIKVTDGEAPQFLDCSDIVVCPDSVKNCKGYVKLYTKVEDCTPLKDLEWQTTIDYHNDGSIDKVVDYGDLSGFIPYGTHKISWTVNDKCMNSSTCTKLVTVKDCVAPTPVCYRSIATIVMPVSGSVTINADVHDAGSFDNCTSGDNLIFSFSSDVTDTARQFTCDDLGINHLPIYVTDEAGNQGVCYVDLEIQDNLGVCLDSLTTHLAGRVLTEEGEGIANVTLSITHPEFGEYLVTSDEEGNYNFASYTDLSGYSSVRVAPVRTDHPLNGVTAYDLFFMHKINLGEMTFENAFQEIAADINNDGKFSTVDLVELKQLILGQYEDFPSNLSWRFVNEMVPMDENNPLDYVEDQNVTLPEYNSRFTGVKIGDINLSSHPSDEVDPRTEDPINFILKDQYVQAGETVDVSMKIPSQDALSFQLYLENNKQYAIENIHVETEGNQNTFLSKNYASVVYYGGSGQDASEILIRFTAQQNGYLSQMLSLSDLRPSLLADKVITERPINLRFIDKHNEGEMSLAIIPNPVIDHTQVYISSPVKQEAILHIYSVNGEVMLQKTVQLRKGKNMLEINAGLQNLTSGVYYISVNNGKELVRKTMVKM